MERNDENREHCKYHHVVTTWWEWSEPKTRYGITNRKKVYWMQVDMWREGQSASDAVHWKETLESDVMLKYTDHAKEQYKLKREVSLTSRLYEYMRKRENQA